MKKAFLYLFVFITFIPSIQVEAQNRYELLYMQNQTDSLLSQVRKNIRSNKPTSEDFYWDAIILQKKGTINKSIHTLKKGLQHFPENTKLTKLLADIYFDHGRYTEAMPILKKYPGDKECQFKISRIHEFNRNYHEATEILEELYENDTTNLIHLKHLADNYYKLDSLSKAITYYRKAVDINPYDQPTAYRLSRLYLKNKEYERALAVCEPILAKDSTSIRFLRQSGYVYYNWKKYDQSKEIFSKILALGDSSAFIYKYLGISELAEKSFQSGRKNLQKAYKKDTSDFEICFYLGKAWLNSPNPEKGLFYLNQADSIVQPDSSVMSAIYIEKQSIYAATGNYQKAVECYHSAYNYDQKPEYLFHIASMYQSKIENQSKALEYYQRFLDALPPKEQPGHQSSNKKIIISLRKVAKNHIKALKKELFFEGKTHSN